MARVTIYLPEEQLELVDSIAKIQNGSWSKMFRLMSYEFLTMIFSNVSKHKREK
jgi:hypothetical protein